MTPAQTAIDQELAQFGWVESVATNSIIDFKKTKSNILEKAIDEKKPDLIDTFICHLIFYVIFCYSLILYLLIDLGFGLFLVKSFFTLIKSIKQREVPSLIPTLSN